MFSVIRNFIRTYIVAEVPNEMTACLDCKAVQCTAEEYATCEYRLSRATGLEHSGTDAEARQSWSPET